MSDSTKYSWFRSLFLELFAAIDKVVYSLISFIYQIFFNVASSSLISGETIKVLFSRIQLILGIAIVFRLAVTLISGIVNPDKITDNKSGAGKLVSKIIIALILLIMIVPLNIPDTDIADGSYEAQLNNNGILFGTLYELQNRILSDNTLAKLVLGNGESVRSDLASNESMKDAGNNLAAVVLKSFITVNMAPGKENATDFGGNNRMCSDSKYDSYINTYLTTNDTTEILNLVTEHCDDGYLFNYTYILSTVSAIIMIIIMIGFTLDVAIRALKLAILRLIAPVPIIGSVDFKNDNNSLNTWGKTVSKTFIDLFLRLIVVFFIIFLLDEFVTNGIIISVSSGMVGKFTYVIIIIALFFFAKEFPKFVVESMGMKYTGGFFSGIGKMMAVGSIAMRMPGMAAASFKASRAATATRNAETERLIEENDGQHIKNVGRRIANSLRSSTSGIRAVMSAATGTVSGVGTGLVSASGAKDHQSRATINAINQRNATQLAMGHAGSTGLGRLGSSLSRDLFGESQAEILKREIAGMEAHKAALEAVKSRMSGEMVKQDWTYGDTGITDDAGNAIRANYKSFIAAIEQAKAAGSDVVSFVDNTGHNQTITVQQAEMQKGFLLKNNEDFYLREVVAGHYDDSVLKDLIRDAEMKGSTKFGGVTKIDDRDSVNKTIDTMQTRLAATKRRNSMNEQNDRFSQQKNNK